jgi:putative ABC transport system substrate-binding protein
MAMRRRDVMLALATSAVGKSSVHAQSAARRFRVGMLWHAGNAEQEGDYFTALVKGFADLGYVEGRNLILEHRYADEQYDRFDGQAAELAAIPVDVIMASVWQAALAAQRVTKTIPIVFVIVPDPVRLGLAESLSRPGRNLTGMSNMMADLIAKRFEMLRDAIDDVLRVGLILNATDPKAAAGALEESRRAAAHFAVEIVPVEVRTPADLEPAFASVAAKNVQAVVTAPDPMLYNERQRLAKLAITHRLPLMTHNIDMVTAGALLGYAANSAEIFRRSTAVVDRILRGGNPAEIPIQQPTHFELRVNLRTAREIGIKIREAALQRADLVIE